MKKLPMKTVRRLGGLEQSYYDMVAFRAFMPYIKYVYLNIYLICSAFCEVQLTFIDTSSFQESNDYFIHLK